MKCKVRLTRTVELVVEGNDEEEIMDWLCETTPEEAYQLAGRNIPQHYEEEIVYRAKDSVKVDYVIGK